MSDATFQITRGSETLKIKPGAKSSVTYKVHNPRDEAVDTEVLLVEVKLPEVGAKPLPTDWLSLTGDAKRSLQPKDNPEFVVTVAVPPGTPTGKFAFRLDALSVRDPNEMSAEGPPVIVDVEEPPPPPPPKPFPWQWVVLAVAVLSLASGGVWWLVSGPTKCAKAEDCSGNTRCALPVMGECLLKEGEACSETLECASFYCDDSNKCALLDEGKDCGFDVQCKNKNCVSGKCTSSAPPTPPAPAAQCRTAADCPGPRAMCIGGQCTSVGVIPRFPPGAVLRERNVPRRITPVPHG